MDTRYLPLGRFMLVGAGLAGGDAYAWVNRTVAGWIEAFGVVRSSDEIYARLNELAAAVPNEADGLTCEPVFRGTRRDPQARGRFAGITFENFTPGHVARAVLEGIARGMYWFYEQAGSHQPAHLKRIIGSGNGLRNNPLLVEAVERIFQRPVFFPEHTEEAAYGAALLAGANTGVWSDLKEAGRTIRLLRVQSFTRQ
jgi:sugar (pentulose or hexulose) kinase